DGVAELRQAWRRWQRRGVDEALPSSLPLVVDGLTHGIAVAADLFSRPGLQVVVPAPFWGNYLPVFSLRTGAEIVPVPMYDDGRVRATALGEALAALPVPDSGEPLIVILNFPSNPGGYMPTAEEREELRRGLVAAAARRTVVAICDD